MHYYISALYKRADSQALWEKRLKKSGQVALYAKAEALAIAKLMIPLLPNAYQITVSAVSGVDCVVVWEC